MPDKPPILAADEPQPFELINGSGRPLIFVCDHAANRVPRSLNGLGVSECHIHDHIDGDHFPPLAVGI